MTSLSDGVPVHYRCDESAGWEPDLEHIRSLVTPRTKAIVVINPNNPTGAVYSREVLEGIAAIAREHSLLVLSDEIYDRILFDGARAHPDGHRRAGPAVPHVQRPVQDVPRGRLPLRLDGRHRAPGARDRVPRGHHPAGVHPPVPQRPRPARGPGRPRRDPEHRRADRPRRPAARAARRRLPRPDLDPRRRLRPPRRRPLPVPAAGPGRARDPRRRAASSTTCWSASTSCWSRAPASTGPPRTTCASSRSRRPGSWRRRSNAWATSCPATASSHRPPPKSSRPVVRSRGRDMFGAARW